MKPFSQITITALGWSLCMAMACADESAPPTYKVGDAWSFSYTDALAQGQNKLMEQTVTLADADKTLLKVVDGGTSHTWEMALDANANLVHSGDYAPTPCDGRLKFPMAVGTTWTSEYDLGQVHYRVDRKVVAFDDVQTQAGSFKAYRIESTGSFKAMQWKEPGHVDETTWYAPSTKRIVKNDWNSKAGSHPPTVVHVELTKMQLAQ